MTWRNLMLAGAASLALTTAAVPVLAQDAAPAVPATSGTLIPIETYELPNGLRVIFHIDRSDPVVAVVLAARVGSARETPGRTGFAHLFEHLFFLNSENLGPGGLDRMSARIGGSGANGSTSSDITDYLQTVPNDALEKMIWAEADKLGFFINTVTQPVVDKERQVVKNEKRQSYDNQPYGHTWPVMSAALYPAGHPYSWPVIGSLADLDAASLEDVQAFYRRWYTPNNTTLVIAGDFDPAQARAWIDKYFGEIARGEDAPTPQPQAANLAQTFHLMHEDGFATLPQLSAAWPTVPTGHPDEAALSVMMHLLTDGKEAPLNAVLIDEKQLTDEVDAQSDNEQIAGTFNLQITAFDGVDLDAVEAALNEGFARFESQGVDPAALDRVKTQAEAAFYERLDTVLGKGRQLARYNAFGTSPDRDLAALRAVTADDVMRVYRTYIKDKPHGVTSFVPEGQVQLAIEGSSVAEVVEEPIVQGAEAAVDPNASQPVTERTPSSFDRTVEPPSGPTPVVRTPDIWTASLPNGLQVSGIQNSETPMASFELSIDGGRLYDDPTKPGTARLLARMMDRGTATKTPAELENAFKALGAAVTVTAGDERMLISGQTLSRNFAATIDLVEEMLFQPRWDPTELTLAKAATTAQIQAQRAQPNFLATRSYNLLAFGPDHILSRNALGTESSVAALTMEDLQTFLATRMAPNHARLRVVGDVDQAAVMQAMADLGSQWDPNEVPAPAWPAPQAPQQSRVYFYDVPGAKQSVMTFGRPSLRRADPDFFPATVMNYRLGGGGFASRLTQQMREGAGYTYGVQSGFTGRESFGQFELRTPVRSNVTLEAAQMARDIIHDYSSTFTPEDLDVTQSAMSRSRARDFEGTADKLGVLETIGDYGLPQSYLDQESAVITGMTVEQIRSLAERYLNTDGMIYVVVGDAATQAARLEALGYGPVVMINEQVAAADR